MNAPDRITEIKAVLAAVFALLTGLWGWTGWAIIVMIACMAMDYLTGTLAARRAGEWSSAIARDGLWHKAGEIFALLVAILCDVAISIILATPAAQIVDIGGNPHYLTLLVAIWYIITELGSILENAIAMGANVPRWLTKGLAKLHQQTESIDPFGEDGKNDGDGET